MFSIVILMQTFDAFSGFFQNVWKTVPIEIITCMTSLYVIHDFKRCKTLLAVTGSKNIQYCQHHFHFNKLKLYYGSGTNFFNTPLVFLEDIELC